MWLTTIVDCDFVILQRNGITINLCFPENYKKSENYNKKRRLWLQEKTT